ncbi:MAG: Hsp20/alpha crystallin family protein [Deltaproteobacteria bacterium]|nr:Hsp20/alpha crystallin family protein [Deltaproteobacteria bacterium]
MKNLTRWTNNQDSFWGLSKLQRDIDRMLDDFITPSRLLNQEGEILPAFSPACDIEETDSYYLVSFDVPGISKDNIKIEVVDDVLTVSGEKRTEQEQKKSAQHLIERSYGQFKRSFTLPAHVDADKVEANYQDGVLTISIAKAESAKPRQIKIGEGKTSLFKRLANSVTTEASQKQEASKPRAA